MWEVNVCVCVCEYVYVKVLKCVLDNVFAQVYNPEGVAMKQSDSKGNDTECVCVCECVWIEKCVWD